MKPRCKRCPSCRTIFYTDTCLVCDAINHRARTGGRFHPIHDHISSDQCRFSAEVRSKLAEMYVGGTYPCSQGKGFRFSVVTYQDDTP